MVNRTYASVLLTAACTIIAPIATAAQEAPSSPWYVTAQVGVYTGGTRIAEGGGVISEETRGQAITVEMARSPVIGVGIHKSLFPYLALRATLQGTLLSGPQARLNAGTESCGTHCTRFLTDHESLGSGGIVAGAVDLAFHAPAAWLVRPYLFYGLGSRHAWYDADDLPDGFAPMNRRFAGGHSGLGVKVGLPVLELNVEAATYGSRGLGFWPILRGGSQTDTFISVGLRHHP